MLKLPHEILEAGRKPWDNTLMGRFLGTPPDFRTITAAVKKERKLVCLSVLGGDNVEMGSRNWALDNREETYVITTFSWFVRGDLNLKLYGVILREESLCIYTLLVGLAIFQVC